MKYGRLKAGIAEGEVTGKKGLRLVSKFSSKTAKGSRTPLFAKALVLSNDEEDLAIVTLDLIGLGKEDCDRTAEMINDQAGIKPESVMISCSHTHAAPYTVPFLGWNDVEKEYVEKVTAKVVEVVEEAKNGLQKASLGTGYALLPHIVYNRRFITRNMKVVTRWMQMPMPKNEILMPEGPTDPELKVFVVRDARGHPICLLWNFAAHNVFSVGDQYSADLPYLVQRGLDERIGRHVPALYLAGCGGNTSFNGSLEDVAGWVSDAAMAVQMDVPCDPMIYLGSRKDEAVLPIRDYSEFWSEFDIKLKFPEALDTYREELEMLREEGANAIVTSVQAFRMGNFALVGMPGEPFVEFGLEIKEKSPFLETHVAGYTNDFPGYVIPRRAFEYAGYESWTARSAKIGPGGGEYLVLRALSLLEGLSREAPLSRRRAMKTREEILGSLVEFDDQL